MSSQPTDVLQFYSYNSTGFNAQRADFICDILDKNKKENCIFAIQEHFIFEKNLSKIEKLLPKDLVVYSIGSFKDNSRILRGRGKGGLSLIWHKSIDHITSRIQVKRNSRLQSLILDLPGAKLLLINSYFPQDTQNDNYDEQDLLETLASVQSLLENNQHDQALLLGDLNADFSRNTRFVRTVKTFCQTNNLETAWNSFPIDYSYSSPSDTSFSTLDHFLVTAELSTFITDAGVIHRGDNISGHSPIYLELSVLCLPKKTFPEALKLPKQNWKEATQEDKIQYKVDLDTALRNLRQPASCLECSNIKCSSEDHREALDTYIVDILEAIETCTLRNIPYKNPSPNAKSSVSGRNRVPGWREHVEPFKQEANFWYQEWRAVGKPRWGLLYDNMRFFRNKFKYAKRRCLSAAEAIKRDRFLESCLEGDLKLFEELKKFKGCPSKVATKVDGHTDPESITDHFKDIYSALYNRTGTDEPLKNLMNEVNDSIEDGDMLDVQKVTPDLIKEIICKKIKPNKSDPEYDLTTDNLKNAPFSLFIHLANFFRGILIHGAVNISLLICAIILLIKNKRGATDDSNNYRGIALSSILLKVFDWVVLLLFDKELENDPNQFGYQAESSANMCTWTAIETVSYFVNRGSTVYACLLDYRKAFDYCNHVIMFQNLLDRNINKVFLRLMIFMYLHQSCFIKWHQTRSYSFSVTNGTIQGGVFSPRGGFATYLDPLLASLRSSGLGCRIAGPWLGGLALADDIILLSLSVQGLQGLVNICEEHDRRTDLVFSTDPDPDKSKTMCIAFKCRDKSDLSSVTLNGVPLPWKDKVNHLGYTLSSDCSSASDVFEKRVTFITNTYNLNKEFNFTHHNTKLAICVVQKFSSEQKK